MRLTAATNDLPVGGMIAVLHYGEPCSLTMIRRTERTWMLVGTLPDGTFLPAVYEPTPEACLSAATQYAANVRAEGRWPA
jgi:hypothetical protein